VAANDIRSTKYHLIIVQLDDTMDRRNPDKPHLYIDYCVSAPEARFKQLQNGAGPSFAVGHYSKLLDVVPYRTPAKTIEIAKRRKSELIEKFSAEGHAVNGNCKQWHVYVINLRQDHLSNKSLKGHVYVGFTSKSIADRVNEHQFGAVSSKGHRLNSKYVTEHFDGLNEKLTPGPFYIEQEAKDREGTLAEELSRKGFLVRAGEKTPDRQ
jgi:hypothetical protein